VKRCSKSSSWCASMHRRTTFWRVSSSRSDVREARSSTVLTCILKQRIRFESPCKAEQRGVFRSDAAGSLPGPFRVLWDRIAHALLSPSVFRAMVCFPVGEGRDRSGHEVHVPPHDPASFTVSETIVHRDRFGTHSRIDAGPVAPWKVFVTVRDGRLLPDRAAPASPEVTGKHRGRRVPTPPLLPQVSCTS